MRQRRVDHITLIVHNGKMYLIIWVYSVFTMQKMGGTNLFLSAYTIHNKILKEKNELLHIFYEKFHFDKRGEFKDGESPTVFEPIFEFKDERLYFRYLRNYIDAGHDIQNQPLSKLQKEALTYLDNLMRKDENDNEI